jgi:AhpD family alkylhydroperoxidase
VSVRIDYEAVAPAGIKALGGVYGYLLQCGLDATLLDLVYLRVSQINGCAYCLDLHTRDLVKTGVGIDKLALVQAWREAGPVFDERERAALAWAETVTLVAETAIPDAEFTRVATVFGEKEIVDLTIAIGLMNTYNRIGIGFRRPPDAALSRAA